MDLQLRPQDSHIPIHVLAHLLWALHHRWLHIHVWAFLRPFHGRPSHGHGLRLWCHQWDLSPCLGSNRARALPLQDQVLVLGPSRYHPMKDHPKVSRCPRDRQSRHQMMMILIKSRQFTPQTSGPCFGSTSRKKAMVGRDRKVRWAQCA